MESISTVIATIFSRETRVAGDYLDPKGFLMCGKCHTRKQTEVNNPFGEGVCKVATVCECRAAELKQEADEKRQRDFQMRVEDLRRDGLTDREYSHWAFEKDDLRNPAISDACLKYVNEWAQMRADNIGLLFFGGVGTGKSFYACCIANALLNQCIPALVTSFPRMLNKLQSTTRGEDRADILDRLQRYELVVIDDLGAERSTDYALEQVYAVVDSRYRSGKPLIVTTNLAPAVIKAPANIGYQRIYDRILQNSITVKVDGVSRRTEIAEKKRNKYRAVLGL